MIDIVVNFQIVAIVLLAQETAELVHFYNKLFNVLRNLRQSHLGKQSQLYKCFNHDLISKERVKKLKQKKMSGYFTSSIQLITCYVYNKGCTIKPFLMSFCHDKIGFSINIYAKPAKALVITSHQ